MFAALTPVRCEPDLARRTAARPERADLVRRPLVPQLFVLSCVLAGLLGMEAVGAGLSLRVNRIAVDNLDSRLLPAQQAGAQLLQSLYEQRTALREFVAGGDLQMLRSIDGATTQTSALLVRLTELLQDRPAAFTALHAVSSAQSTWLSDGVQASVAARRSIGAAAAELTFDQHARPDFDRLRDAMVGMTAVVQGQLEHEQQTARRARSTINALLLSTAALSALVGLAAAFVVRRSLTRPLRRLVNRIGEVADGNLEVPVPTGGPRELADLGGAAERMRRRLLDEARHRVQSALIAGEEETRRRIAGEIHDDQVQAMTAVSLRLQQLRHRVRDDELRELVVEAEATTKRATARLRRMIFELYSPVLDSEGLVAALDLYLEETFGLDTDGCRWCLEDAPIGHVPAPLQALAYRLATEAMWNVHQHAAAPSLSVRIEADDRGVGVTVSDTGRGFDPAVAAAAAGHLGLVHCRQLAEGAGGWWRVDSAPKAGTTVSFRLPITGADAEASARSRAIGPRNASPTAAAPVGRPPRSHRRARSSSSMRHSRALRTEASSSAITTSTGPRSGTVDSPPIDGRRPPRSIVAGRASPVEDAMARVLSAAAAGPSHGEEAGVAWAVMTGPVRVLLVDDHEIVARGILSLLERAEGVEVVPHASSAAEAVSRFRQYRPDVVLMDYRLPDGDGAGATRALLAIDPEARVVMLSADANRAVLSAALEAGCLGFVPKDAEVDDLVAAIHRAAAGESYFTSELLSMLVALRTKRAGASPTLSERECEVLQLTADGRTVAEIAGALFLSPHTVRNHLRHLMEKLDAHTKLEAVVKGARANLIAITADR